VTSRVFVRQTISREQFSGDSVHTDYGTHIGDPDAARETIQ
jgi:hypothetical protein